LNANEELIERARGLWESLAYAPGAFREAAPLAVVASAESRICPPNWVGIVRIDGKALVTVPDDVDADRLCAALQEIAVESVTEVEHLARVLPIAEVLGPATLAYVSPEEFLPFDAPDVEQIENDNRGVVGLREAVSAAEADESGLAHIDSPAFVLRKGDAFVSAAGYTTWIGMAAHVSVLTREDIRGRGLARQVASAVVKHALNQGLLPQWRARPAASRRVAQVLGFRELGAQLSFRLA
jgi:GNAT superfamily N-acetyltransferase